MSTQAGGAKTTTSAAAAISSPIQPTPVKVVNISPSQTLGTPTTPGSPATATQNRAVNTLNSTGGALYQVWNSQAGQGVLDVTMSAGGKILQDTAASPLQYVPVSVSLLTDVKTKNWPGAANTITESAVVAGAQAAAPYLVTGAGALGPQMLIGGVAAGSYLFGQDYVAPLVAPTISGWMYSAAPALFTPAAQ